MMVACMMLVVFEGLVAATADVMSFPEARYDFVRSGKYGIIGSGLDLSREMSIAMMIEKKRGWTIWEKRYG